MTYDTLATQATINQTMDALKQRGMLPESLENKDQALARIKELISAGASVTRGASVTLEQIGFADYLKSGEHSWNNLHEKVAAEKDPAKRAELRKQAAMADYYLGSVHGLAQTGQMVIASNTGSQLPHIAFTSPNLIFVVGAQKITPDLPGALKRLEDYVVPLENEHMKQLYGMGTFPSKILIFNKEAPMLKRTVRVLIVNEKLGF